MFSLKDKKAFIAGGATGIGLAVVKHEKQVAAAFELAAQQLGKLDIVINNVGIMLGSGSFEKYPTTSFEKMIEVNMKGVFYGLKYAPRYMVDGGSIINTVSQIAFTKIPGN